MVFEIRHIGHLNKGNKLYFNIFCCFLQIHLQCILKLNEKAICVKNYCQRVEK